MTVENKIDGIMFEKIKEYSNDEIDTRFMRCKIWLMHMGKNLNNSIFDKEVVVEALPTLANTPILAYVEENSKGELDVSDHRQVLEKGKDGKFDLVYKGQAIGTIPETNNAKFETRLCDDGIEREFLTVEGLVWTKWKDINEIFANENIKGQSMELDPNSYTGHMESDGFHFDSFKFNGACAISVQPAMVNSTIEVSFSAKTNMEEIQTRLQEFETYFAKKEVNMEDNKENQNFEEDIQSTEDEVVEDVIEASEKEPEPENEVQDDTVEDEPETEEACDSNDEKKKFEIVYSLSHEDIRCKLYEKLWTIESTEDSYCYIYKTMDDSFQYSEEKWSDNGYETKYYEQFYVIENDEIVFETERKELFQVLVDSETYEKIKDVTYSNLEEELTSVREENSQFSTRVGELTVELENVKSEMESLVEFKKNADEEARKSEIDAVLNKFSKVKSLDLEGFRKKAYEKEIAFEELENVLYAEVGRINMSATNFSVKEQETKNETNFAYHVNLEDKKDDFEYSELKSLFRK